MCKVHCIFILLGTFYQFCLPLHVPVCVCTCAYQSPGSLRTADIVLGIRA